MTKTLTPKTADRSLKGRIASKVDLLKRLLETEARHNLEGNPKTAAIFGEMADEVQLTIETLRAEGRAAS